MSDLGRIYTFDLLTPGTVSLGVPVENGAIQLHRRRDEGEKTRLAVVIEPECFSVAREDNVPLQIQAHFENYVEGEGYVPTSLHLLEEPVAQMTFVRSLGLWTINEVAIVDKNKRHLASFANRVGSFALRKQKTKK